jgi:hypothetical protein
MSSDSLLSPSSALAADPAPTEDVYIAEEHTSPAAAMIVVEPPLIQLPVELRLQISGYVLVNQQGAALIVKIGSHASGEPRISKALVGEVRDVFFGQNILDLTMGYVGYRASTRTSYPLSAMPGSISSCGHSPRLRSRKSLLSLTSLEHIVGSRR